ncbi:antitoxin [Actinocorallia sp. B10E7]|uniref:antitoxin n=1 Tax=Actinocorallia sp. B10E7 TaxID=3153558 RepID=UPI00325D5F43
MSIVQKFMDLLGKHGDKAGPAIDKAGDMVDRKTGGKYHKQIDEVQRKAREAAEQQARRGQQPPTSR